MSRFRASDRGSFRGANIELMVVVAIIAVLAAIAIPQLLRFKFARRAACLDNLAALAAGPLPPGTTCPASDKPYAAAIAGNEESIACPAPAEHVETNPAFFRPPGGTWNLRQTLPADAGAAIEFESERVMIDVVSDRTLLRLRTHRFSRWFGTPLFLLAILFVLGFCIYGFVAGLKEKLWSGVAIALVIGTATGFGVYACLVSIFGYRDVAIDRTTRSVTVGDYLFGCRRSESTYTACLGIVPVIGTNKSERSLKLVHAPTVDGKRTTSLGSINESRLDVATWLNRALLGP